MSPIQSFNFQNTNVRVEGSGDNSWFCASDVCAILEIKNPRNAYARLDDDEKGVRIMDTPSGKQEMVVVNESGLYGIIFQSRKPSAKAFRKWVRSEVLPSIRKTGSYTATISPEQKAALKEAMKLQHERTGKIYGALWGRFNNHFKVGEYKELPAARFDEAMRYIQTLFLDQKQITGSGDILDDARIFAIQGLYELAHQLRLELSSDARYFNSRAGIATLNLCCSIQGIVTQVLGVKPDQARFHDAYKNEPTYQRIPYGQYQPMQVAH